mmetsp:Transcript_158843/g.509286  ORF Transcript_158843/g.509286 Transcript_158843/m.509286 type:complete len:157 (+) Transcript_158843:607-1077(+)
MRPMHPMVPSEMASQKRSLCLRCRLQQLTPTWASATVGAPRLAEVATCTASTTIFASRPRGLPQRPPMVDVLLGREGGGSQEAGAAEVHLGGRRARHVRACERMYDGEARDRDARLRRADGSPPTSTKLLLDALIHEGSSSNLNLQLVSRRLPNSL